MSSLTKYLAGTGMATMLSAYAPILAEEQSPIVLAEYNPAQTIQADQPDISHLPPLTVAFYNAQQVSGTVLDMDMRRPDAGHVHTVQPHETLWGLAGRFQAVMGADSRMEALETIVAKNGLTPNQGSTNWQDIHLRDQQALYIPLPPGVEIHNYKPENPTTAIDLAGALIGEGKIPDEMTADPITLADTIARLNNLDDVGAEITDKVAYPAIDDFAHINPLAAPPSSWGIKATLSVAEFLDEHHYDVFEYATDMATAINPDHDRGTIMSILTKADVSLSFNLAALNEDVYNKPSADEQLIFSRSVAYKHDDLADEDEYRQKNSLGYSGPHDDVHFFANSPHVYFVAAGNWRESREHEKDGEQHTDINRDTIVAIPEAAASRAYVIGAAHNYSNNDESYLANYSSVGADFLGPAIPRHNGEFIAGTSFATPITAVLGRQMIEWYGGVLEPQEIMAAASMTTDMNVDNFDSVLHPPNAGQNLTITDTYYTTNAGGRPHHERAGAGMIDLERWNETLREMAIMKLDRGLVSDYFEQAIPLADIQPELHTNGHGEMELLYKIPIPEDLTLDRLSFILPQNLNERADSYITSPSGFTVHMPMAMNQTMGTSAFSLEDVKAGDVLEIRSSQPYAEGAVVHLRGYHDNNIVQHMRDHLQETGAMPQPNSLYANDRLIPMASAEPSPALPEPGFFERVFDSLKF